MAKVLVDKDFLEEGLELICDKIRLKTGGTGVLAFPVEIADAVESIEGSGGITPTGTKTITANGTGIDVRTYAAVDVAVPMPAGGGYDAAEMGGSKRLATAASNKKLTADFYVPDAEGLAGVYITGTEKSLLRTVFSLLLVGSGNNWNAEKWWVGDSGPAIGLAAIPQISLTSEKSGDYNHYTIEITLTGTTEVFSTATENYAVMPIRMIKSE